MRCILDSQTALNNLQGYNASIASPQQELQNAQNNLGVGTAQQQVTGLQEAVQNTSNLLSQVAPSVMGRTGQSLVTAGQQGGQIKAAQAPIQQSLTNDTNNYNQANQNLTNLQGQAQNQVTADQTAQTNQLSYLEGIYNDLAQSEASNQQLQTSQNQFNQEMALAK